jgi:hypothetical protein
VQVVKAPRKQMYRMRAHSNPLNDATFPVPLSPDQHDWCAAACSLPPVGCVFCIAAASLPVPPSPLSCSPSPPLSLPLGTCPTPQPTHRASHYPELFAEAAAKGAPAPRVDFADVGCGFGGLTVGLADAYPDKVVLGMELRDKVTGAPVLGRGWAVDGQGRAGLGWAACAAARQPSPPPPLLVCQSPAYSPITPPPPPPSCLPACLPACPPVRLQST